MAIDEQPATKQDLEVVKQNLEALRGDLKGELAAVERRLVERIDDVEAHFTASLDERLEGMETRLLTAFENG